MNSILDEFKNAFNRPNNGLMKILVINLVVFLALIFFRVILAFSGAGEIYELILRQLMLPAALDNFIVKPWTLITYFFTHEGFFHILFNLLFLYWFGSLIMEFLGSQKFVNLYVLGGLAGGLFYILIYNTLPYFADAVDTSRMLGASAGVYAVVVGAATFMPNYTIALILLGPVRIKYIAIFYVILSFAQSAGPNAGGELAHLAGAALGFIYIKQLQSGNDLGKPLASFFSFIKSFFVRQPKVKVSYRNAQKKRSNGRPTADTQSKQEEIDAILDKISESGYDSLTKEEKQKLFDASKN
ncbi:membrane associated rhomboid family serine protease [Catalinimonas alkaloidigena]|uniref:rhomboid family protein n=1 Tax=Catalinimonas alkaloidigena TaxID=1075417 RepID=UPI0024054047|nr:rhomboid family intramembrane serine protease [Catalinimonas alkaloidigena]MDF9800728.1 membrane associated rhomboid family serine protease [Catalinimonas alkaloidigena]